MSAPYYQDEHVTLYLGDWRELIPKYFTADLILTDPPYGETSLVWDRWPHGWPTLAARHSRSMWCFGSMRMFLDRRDDFADWKLSQDIVWRKPRARGTATDRFARVHEHATHWYIGDWATISRTAQRVPYYGPRVHVPPKRAKAARGQVRPMASTVEYEDDGTRLMSSVLEGAAGDPRTLLNPTQKPVAVLEPLISYGCPPGGTVLDLFAGSGSTLVAARNLGRLSVGYELREEQAEKTALRLSQGILDFGDPA